MKLSKAIFLVLAYAPAGQITHASAPGEARAVGQPQVPQEDEVKLITMSAIQRAIFMRELPSNLQKETDKITSQYKMYAKLALEADPAATPIELKQYVLDEIQERFKMNRQNWIGQEFRNDAQVVRLMDEQMKLCTKDIVSFLDTLLKGYENQAINRHSTAVRIGASDKFVCKLCTRQQLAEFNDDCFARCQQKRIEENSIKDFKAYQNEHCIQQ